MLFLLGSFDNISVVIRNTLLLTRTSRFSLRHNRIACDTVLLACLRICNLSRAKEVR